MPTEFSCKQVTKIRAGLIASVLLSALAIKTTHIYSTQALGRSWVTGREKHVHLQC